MADDPGPGEPSQTAERRPRKHAHGGGVRLTRRLVHVLCVMLYPGFSAGQGGFVVGALREAVDYRDSDHAGGVGGHGFVVAGKASVLHDPTEGAFDDPAAFDHGESF